MGKPETMVPAGPSMEDLLASIRDAINSDLRPAPPAQPPTVGTAPEAPRLSARLTALRAARDAPAADVAAPAVAPPAQAAPAPQAAPVPPDSNSRLKDRYSLARSRDFMNLRNRLANLAAGRRQPGERPFANLLGGELRLEEALARVRDRAALDAATSAPAALRPSFDLPEAVPAAAAPEPEVIAEPEPIEVSAPEPELAEPPAPEAEAAAEPEPEPPAPADPGLAEQAVAAAFGRLEASLAAGPDGSLPELTRELLKPMLKDWLDGNLPSIVEALVREEIERIARRRS